MKRLAARAPGLDIFTSGYVLREDCGWLITDLGRQFLASIEAPPVEPALDREDADAVAPGTSENVIQLAEHKLARRRRVAA